MASSSSIPCPMLAAIDHSQLPFGGKCPVCDWRVLSTVPSSSSFEEEEAAVTLTPASTPSQYIPITSGAVRAQLQAISVARGTSVTHAAAFRKQAITKAQTAAVPASPKVPAPTLFTVKVAWAIYSDELPPTTTWRRFNEDTTVAILHSALVRYDTLKDTFRQQIQAQPVDYFRVITTPANAGHWAFSTNWLTATTNPTVPAIWPGEFRIQDVITFTSWRPNIKGIYPATLLFYPNIPQPVQVEYDDDHVSVSSFRLAFGDDSILPEGRKPVYRSEPHLDTPSPTFAPSTLPNNAIPDDTLEETLPNKKKGKGKDKGKGKAVVKRHKRMISEAIPANERETQSTRVVMDEALARTLQAEEEDEALFMPQVEEDTQENTQEDAQEDAQTGAQEGTRRSGRARKLKK
jgi:hypothetical protein